LVAAERLFAEQGFGRVTMPAIAHTSGITAGAIYKHFDNKADLFFEVVRRAVQATAASATVENPSDTMSLPNVVASYTTRGVRLLRQLAVEVHYASAKHPQVRRLLRQSLDRQIQQISEYLAAGQKAGKVAAAVDPEFLACAVLVFIMGLMHMETLVPQLINDSKWCDFVRERTVALLCSPAPC
jgi:AcrR family transcriptional regulator